MELDMGDGGRTVILYPNPIPGNQELSVEGHNWKDAKIKLVIYDINGKLLKQATVENPSAYFRKTLPVSGLAKGEYLLSIQAEGTKPKVLKFVVQ